MSQQFTGNVNSVIRMHVGYISADRVIDRTSLGAFEESTCDYLFFFDGACVFVANSGVTSVLTVRPDPQLTASSGGISTNMDVHGDVLYVCLSTVVNSFMALKI